MGEEEYVSDPVEAAAPASPSRLGFRARLKKADQEAVRRYAATTPFLWVWAIVVGLAALQIYFDPFGFSNLTQRYSQDLVNLTLTGPLYSNKGAEEVSVVLIEDDSLKTLEMTWPMSYGDHARALDAILAYEPRAVAVDILFVDRRNDRSLEDLVTVIGRYKRAGVPIYFAGSPRTSPVLADIVQAGATVVDVSVAFDGGVARNYPMTGACLDGSGEPRCPSFAVKMYNDAYKTRVAPDADPDTRIELVWGTDTYPINRSWRKIVTDEGKIQCPEEPGVLERLYHAVLDVSRLQALPLCPHTAIVPAEALIRGDEDKDFPALLGGRLVFYGAHLEGSADLAHTPSNGMLARVFVHAMALDNLITFNGRPKRDSITLFGITIGKNEIELFTIAIILLVITRQHIRRIRTLAGAADPDAVEVPEKHQWSWYWLLVGMVVLAGVVLYLGFSLSIGNWVELVFISGLLFQFLTSPYLGRQWGRFRYAIGV